MIRALVIILALLPAQAWAVVAFEGVASDIVTSTDDVSIDVSAPAGTGGRLYAIGNCAHGRTIAPPAGWTEVVNNTDGTISRTYLWMRADDAQSTYTFTASATFNTAVVSVYRLSGASTNTPTTAFDTGTNSQTQTCPTITTPSADCLVFWGCCKLDVSTATADKGTERVDTSSATGGYKSEYTNPEATAGSITGAVVTTTAFGAKRVFSFAVESDGGGGGGTGVVVIIMQLFACLFVGKKLRT